MNNPSLDQRPAETGRMAGLTRLIRQVCLLREQGDAARALRLQENDVAATVREFRQAQGPAALPEGELRAMFATEERRVAEAAILSELLLPRLVGYMPATAGPSRPGTVRTEPVPAAAKASAPAAGPPAIPDLLDAMLAAERLGRRQSPATQRES